MPGGARQERAHVAEEVRGNGSEHDLHHQQQAQDGGKGTGGVPDDGAEGGCQ